ncbi:response regulator transcription factor [Microbacterium sp. 4R-513]|uniref:response regulator transcription factor n=1 Tax=Microbacterium sp. 4R-513 TaxID=2567934 RepID=UPI0013E131A0|nr:response regulator transcription factor [Microbacterium sp. 4R-513]QIG41131.1 response regulator transcription factor [Microbacterium sp. 4R-513]
MGQHILVVEDDDGIALPLVRTLTREGYDVERVAAGATAIDRVLGGEFSLVVLDLGLPDMDGLDVCRRVRDEGYEGGIVILTARDGELDRVVGLDVGADDYIAKPFALAELLARLRALLRRSAAAASKPAAARAAASGTPLTVDPDSRRAFAGEREIPLSTKEFDLLANLDRQRGAVVTRERVMDEVWDENWFGSTKTLDVTIARLRQKLEDSGADVRITTIRGIGFRLDDGAADA